MAAWCITINMLWWSYCETYFPTNYFLITTFVTLLEPNKCNSCPVDVVSHSALPTFDELPPLPRCQTRLGTNHIHGLWFGYCGALWYCATWVLYSAVCSKLSDIRIYSNTFERIYIHLKNIRWIIRQQIFSDIHLLDI